MQLLLLSLLLTAGYFSSVVGAAAPVAASPGYPSCNICGQDGHSVTIKDATVSFPGYPPFTCDAIQRGALSGFVKPMYCPVFPFFNIPKICGCAATPTSTPPTLQPVVIVVAPTSKPSLVATLVPVSSPTAEPTDFLIDPTLPPFPLALAPNSNNNRTSASPTTSPTSHVVALPPPQQQQPTKAPLTTIVQTFAPFSPTPVPVAPTLLAPNTIAPSSDTPFEAPSSSSSTPTDVTVPTDATSVPTLATSPSSSNNNKNTIVVPTIRPYIARKRRPTMPFHVGDIPTPRPISSDSGERPISTSPMITSRMPSSITRTRHPRRRRRRKPNAVRNNDDEPTLAPGITNHSTRRRRRKPKIDNSTSNPRKEILTPAPVAAERNPSPSRGQSNIFYRGQPSYPMKSKQFKTSKNKKFR